MNAPDNGFPLTWPAGWTRKTGGRERARFGRGSGANLTAARNLLFAELGRLKVRGILISSNLPLRLDGLPRGDAREPGDSGVAIYFRLKGEPRVLACDKWDRVADNIMAIAKHVEAVRGQVRWGVGSLEQAFGGYKALPAMEAIKPWWEVLGIPEGAGVDAVERARNSLLMRHHPDKGGSHARAAEINAAADQANRELAS